MYILVLLNQKSSAAKKKTTEKILELPKNFSAISIKEESEKLAVSYRTVDWNIRKLPREGKIKRIGSDKGGHWEVLQ